MRLRVLLLALLVCMSGFAKADGPGDNLPDNVRRIPPPGIAVPDADRAELSAGIAQLGREIDSLKASLKGKPALLDLLPDVQIYHNAVRYALNYNEFYNPREIATAKAFIKQGLERAALLKQGKSPWTEQTGLVARGYVSKIDGSVQPYGLVVPANYQPSGTARHRLDIWFHGRGETLSELSFIDGRQKSMGDFAPEGAFVLHPYGRYCNANKFAGEIDTFEGMDHVRKHYRIDPDRIAVRGFSMGGAACWQFGTHFAGDWAAIAPGAGFSETPDFLKVFQNEPTVPTWWEQKLWHLYDSVDYALNLFNCPTVAYSGEVDGQRQAAEMMTKAMDKEGLKLVHIIGPKAGHFYEANAKKEVAQRVDALVEKGRDNTPKVVKFTTWTLRYNRMKWLTVDGLEKHWERARVEAQVADDNTTIAMQTENVSALTLSFAPGQCPLEHKRPTQVAIDGMTVKTPPVAANGSWTVHLRKEKSKWQRVNSVEDNTLRKRHDLQGPIDDAFMDHFIMVRPTGSPLNEKLGTWTKGEMAHAVDHWRRQYRGEAQVKDDTAINKEDIADANLILWGDPQSNAVLKRIAAKLPIRWDAEGVHVGGKIYGVGTHVPILIYPNPLNPKRYVVLNSGFTFREYDYLNNARQNAKLPDWAVVDITTPPSSRWPGRVVDAAFFDEKWELTDERK